jgi:HlyD family secretion protein
LQAPELFVVARNLSDMQVEASIDEADIARIRSGQKATFTVDAFPGRSFEGAVRQVRKAAVSAQNVVTYTVVIAFKSSARPAQDGLNPSVGSALLPGMTASVRIATEQHENVLKVPNAALRVRLAQEDASSSTRSASTASDSGRSKSDGGKSANSAANSARIYVLNSQGQAVAQRVRLGLSDGISTEVTTSTLTSAEHAPDPRAQNTLVEGAPVIVAVESAQTAAERATKPTANGMPRMPF